MTEGGAVNDIIPGGEGEWLVLDAALPAVHAGVLRRGVWSALERREGPAAETLFPAVERVLQRAGTRIDALSGFLYCEGPGSVLGLRIAAMAIRTWSRRPEGKTLPCRVYRNLDLMALQLLEGGERAPFGLCSDARRGHWNYVEIDAGGRLRTPRRLSDEDLAAVRLPLWRPEEHRPLRPSPVATQTVFYDLSAAAPWLVRPSFTRRALAPEPWVMKPPEYRKVGS